MTKKVLSIIGITALVTSVLTVCGILIYQYKKRAELLDIIDDDDEDFEDDDFDDDDLFIE